MKKKVFNPLNSNTNQLVLVGRKAIIDTINHDFLKQQIEKIILTSSQNYIQELLTKANLAFEIQSKNWFEQKFKTVNHQNCCIILKTKPQISLEQLILKTQKEAKSVILILDQIQDPHNFGAILRTAAAAGVSGVIVLNKNQAKLNTTVLKVSAGLGLLVDVVEVNNLNHALDKLKKAGFWLYASLLSARAQNYREIIYDAKSVLIIGNEGDGISALLAKNSDFQIMIPMDNNADSLNVSVATGILLFEMIK